MVFHIKTQHLRKQSYLVRQNFRPSEHSLFVPVLSYSAKISAIWEHCYQADDTLSLSKHQNSHSAPTPSPLPPPPPPEASRVFRIIKHQYFRTKNSEFWNICLFPQIVCFFSASVFKAHCLETFQQNIWKRHYMIHTSFHYYLVNGML
jgi:hypothetical protein